MTPPGSYIDKGPGISPDFLSIHPGTMIEIGQAKVTYFPDLDGRPFSLAIFRDDLSFDQKIPEDLRLRGVNKLFPSSADDHTLDYFGNALIRLPYPLAVHATFNCFPRPDLKLIPISSERPATPLIGVEGEPWSGKTLFLLALTTLEDDRQFGIRDFDPFGVESISNCLEDIKRKIPPGTSLNAQNTVDTIMEIYDQKRKSGQKIDTSRLTLRSMFDQLLTDYQGGNPREFYLLDLPGTNSPSAPPHLIQLLRHSLPTINIADAIEDSQTLSKRCPPGSRVPLSQKYAFPGSAYAYFLHLRNVLLDPANRRKKPSSIDLALNKNRHRQSDFLGNLIQHFSG